ncbi:hypothetical protein O1611_g8541 [Lasiodiplodia mahajangana]|uniref:Uncharacterized protein n=1 Tax=Lasiodiplodia mahajangana TaxID=1108764 RepID=A0ACC2JCB0_9PEZI|nr:hypothetical protein O1611_g8541 [Lasiodiplodia mahajangana]
MAVGTLELANGCLGCEKMEAEQEELNEDDEDKHSSPDESVSHDLGMLIVSRSSTESQLKPNPHWMLYLATGASLGLGKAEYPVERVQLRPFITTRSKVTARLHQVVR